MTRALIETVFARHAAARARRTPWEGLWQDCYDHALPGRAGVIDGGPAGSVAAGTIAGPPKYDRLFDGTAPDAVDQLAASLLARLTPPWSRWFGLAAGPDIEETDKPRVEALLTGMAGIVQAEFDRSNFTVEVHQCFLDLVTAGTASLALESAPVGSPSALRFTAIPLAELVLDEGPDRRLDVTFRHRELSLAELRARWPKARIPRAVTSRAREETDAKWPVLEAVLPASLAAPVKSGTGSPTRLPKGGYVYAAIVDPDLGDAASAVLLQEATLATSPFLNFRWLKAPGEVWGRSPVMKALPDIKTANKVVELTLKNASIAVAGIWQADDDGVINPANIQLTPGTIIPKAVGSAGLTPLEAPGKFDVSDLVLSDLRKRIRQALLTDQLGPPDSPQMTATEVLERAAETGRVLGAIYGRLQAEFLNPLTRRALAILKKRGLIEDLEVDGRMVELQYRSPLARDQAKAEVETFGLWARAIREMGPEGLAAIDTPAAARWMGRTLGVPAHLIREADETPERAAGAVSAANTPPAESADPLAAFAQAPAAPPSADLGEFALAAAGMLGELLQGGQPGANPATSNPGTAVPSAPPQPNAEDGNV